MPRILLFLSLLGVSLASLCKIQPLSDEDIFFINTHQSSWKAGRTFDPKELQHVIGLLGGDINGTMELAEKMPQSNAVIRNDLPEAFDARTKWPHCKSLNEIRDQSSCGSCWVLAPVEVMTDRICIHTNKIVHISAEEVLACNSHHKGCSNGGKPNDVWEYYQTEGIVSGGNYNSGEGCMPYSLPNCEHHMTPVKYKSCGELYSTPTCNKKCRQGYSKTYEQDKHYGTQLKKITGVENIKQELVDNGPVFATIDIYSEFFSYKSGVYKVFYPYGKLGTHVVKILGYGDEGYWYPNPYWLVANSWNEDWGDKGFIKIGQGQIGIEKSVYAGLPRAN